MSRKVVIIVFLVSIILMMSSCSGSDPVSLAIESYLEAIVAKEPITAINLSCSAWEGKASAEGSAFEGVEVELIDPTCQVIEKNENQATVTCESILRFSYDGGETQELDLSDRQYIASFENGEWKMCGYK